MGLFAIIPYVAADAACAVPEMLPDLLGKTIAQTLAVR
jgi:hypothetical protein